MSGTPERKPFTGRHAAIILVAFFGVVIGVNMVMASFALSTFGGTVVDNSYVASQHYNEWLARAEAQDRLGWEESVAVDESRHVRLTILEEGAPLQGLRVIATLRHPLGQAPARAMDFAPDVDGTLRSVEPLPAGRWQIDLSVRRGANEARYRVDLQ
ncbi:FixH family protein [Sphingopyxis sp. 113P3]|uniref:FixH family protein n=1 Tax=Sphingopyxis sp. (strain 113P3) TaxID=292913 RepID=UPI0006AD11A1|nr:FixH family protein [Sphingopyxis sp. 113P3]ALC12863.1 integral membrane protein linked to a cation pump [Sphingopyxis sp. 113P3]